MIRNLNGAAEKAGILNGDLVIGPLGGVHGEHKCAHCNAPLFMGETRTKCCVGALGSGALALSRADAGRMEPTVTARTDGEQPAQQMLLISMFEVDGYTRKPSVLPPPMLAAAYCTGSGVASDGP